MAKRKGVSGKTHTKQQLNDYANQNNPNNKAYRARRTNEEKARKTRNHFDQDMLAIRLSRNASRRGIGKPHSRP